MHPTLIKLLTHYSNLLPLQPRAQTDTQTDTQTVIQTHRQTHMYRQASRQTCACTHMHTHAHTHMHAHIYMQCSKIRLYHVCPTSANILKQHPGVFLCTPLVYSNNTWEVYSNDNRVKIVCTWRAHIRKVCAWLWKCARQAPSASLIWNTDVRLSTPHPLPFVILPGQCLVKSQWYEQTDCLLHIYIITAQAGGL